ncbi:MAG: hypothetical protein MAG431_00986 [Chloroflexi bacterium]|nr:hypothetical protein [Chloroflexota bacterium]
MRKLIVAIVILLGVVFVVGRFSEVESIINTLKKGDWRYFLMAFFLLLLWRLNIAGFYKAIFQNLGTNESLSRLTIISSAATFINTIAPSAGIGGMTVFIAESRQNGNTGARAMVAGALYVIYNYLGFFFLLGMGIIVLIRRDNLNITQITASFILLLICAGMSFLLYLGNRSEEKLADALEWLARTGNRLLPSFIWSEKFSIEKARGFAHDAVEGIGQLRRDPKDLLFPLLFSVVNKGLLLLIFFLMFKAFGIPVSIGTVVAGVSLAYLFRIVSPTPSGVGVVEGMLTLALRSMFMAGNDALVVTLAYRGFTFWVPFILGGIAFRMLGSPTSS